jgi:hypothetical protein
MVFAKLKNFFAKLIFSRQNLFLLRKIFLFPNTKKSFGGKKINLAKSMAILQFHNVDFYGPNFDQNRMFSYIFDIFP